MELLEQIQKYLTENFSIFLRKSMEKKLFSIQDFVAAMEPVFLQSGFRHNKYGGGY